MAGDWMKIELSMPEKKEVLHVARILDIRPDEAAGMIIRFWAWVQVQVDDGRLLGLKLEDIDRKISRPGFAQAMVEAG